MTLEFGADREVVRLTREKENIESIAHDHGPGGCGAGYPDNKDSGGETVKAAHSERY